MRLNALKGFLMRSAEPPAAAAEASSASIPAEICVSEVTCPRAKGLASPRCAGKRAADATEACVATSASTRSVKARAFMASVGFWVRRGAVYAPPSSVPRKVAVLKESVANSRMAEKKREVTRPETKNGFYGTDYYAFLRALKEAYRTLAVVVTKTLTHTQPSRRYA